MITQTTEPKLSNSEGYLSFSSNRARTLKMINDLLNEGSRLKKGVKHDPSTVVASTNALLGALATDGSLETMERIYVLFSKVLFNKLQCLARKRGLPLEFQTMLKRLCGDLRRARPFAHRTTVQRMLNGHKKESSDRWLGRSFQQCIEELDAARYKPPKVALNQDPHFKDFKPAFRNEEIRQTLIGGRTTLKTGYQFNLANITPIGLFVAIGFAPKRQKNKQDLGDLNYAITFGKAAERVQQAGLPLVNFQGDRGLEDAGLFVISQKHAWPTASGEIGALKDYTQGVFLVTPWTSTRLPKAGLIAKERFAEIMVIPSEFSRNQYAGDQSLARAVVGPSPKCKIPVETVILVLRKIRGKYCNFSPQHVQEELSIFEQKVNANEILAESLKNGYLTQLRRFNPSSKERGRLMKLNAKSLDQLPGEPTKAWVTRKQYHRVKRSGKALKQRRDAFLRSFLVFEVGADAAALELLKGPQCKGRSQLVSALKSCCKEYNSRWCIESGYETIEYHFPLQYQGFSSNTHLRAYVVRAIVFNSYRVAQITHVGNAKPPNWRPWEEKKKIRCRQFRASDLQAFSAKAYILELLRESLENFFCRILS